MRPARLERATSGSGGQRSIQLSYGRSRQARNLAGDWQISIGEAMEAENVCVPIFSLQSHLARMKMFARLAGGRARLGQDYGAARKGNFHESDH
jgi:hypothetical protein